MQTTHHVTLSTFLNSLGNQLENSFNAYHIRIPNLLPLTIILVSIFIIIFLIRKIFQFVSVLQEKQIFLEITPPAFTQKESYTTQQLFLVLHDIGRQLTFRDRLLGKKMLFSFEIVSTRKEGIRYVIRTTESQKESIKRAVVSYLPQVRVKEVSDYIPQNIDLSHIRIGEFGLRKHFAFPLAKQNVLDKHDPVAYVTGMMTQLEEREMVSLQIVTSSTITEQTSIIANKILRNEDVLKHLKKNQTISILKVFTWTIDIILKIVKETIWGIADILTSNPGRDRYAYQQATLQNYQQTDNLRPVRVLSTFEQEVISSVQEKIDQPLFETSIRTLVFVKGKEKQNQRLQGLRSSLAVFSVPKYQSFAMKYTYPVNYVKKLQLFLFRKRLLSLVSNHSSTLLSASEIADMYHFPFARITQTENIVKAYSKELPAPLSLKRKRKLDVIFGENIYGGKITPIGLTKEERATHAYLIGRTGSGKTTLMFSMSMHDIENGNGMAFVDPHGDISEDLLASISEERKKDLIYFNPIDLKHPIGINLLELTPGLDEDEAELEKEVVAEGVISLFRKVFSKDEQGNAHRIEYILRNTIYTAFTVEDATLFTIYDILNNPPIQKQVIAKLTDENLKNFWKYEFGKAGDYQSVKMASGVTAKVGRFLFSPTAKRILEQKKSTIDFNTIMNEGKILICNVSQGNLGEDTARLLGTTILTKIQQAALRRSKIAKNQRRPFYLYVDEFQNFATNSFIKLLSEGRKYGLSVTIAEQSTAQQEDRNIVNNILANVTTVICFRSANPIDEQLMLTQFSPFVEKGDITNLPRYQFYIKISALEPEETFSGRTIFIPIKQDEEKIQRLMQSSRDQYAIVYQKSTTKQKKVILKKGEEKEDDSKEEEPTSEDQSALPEYQ